MILSRLQLVNIRASLLIITLGIVVEMMVDTNLHMDKEKSLYMTYLNFLSPNKDL